MRTASQAAQLSVLRNLVIALSMAAIIFGIPSTRSAAWPSSDVFKQDAHGLEKQFEPFLKAYGKGDTSAQDQAFNVFQLPDAKSWFGQYFQPEDAQQLAWDSESEAEGERNSLRMLMGIMERGGRFRAHCKVHTSKESGSVAPRKSRVNPQKPVPVEQFDIELQADRSGKRFSFLGNFVYVNGAYRFVGKGAFPFWSMPDANDPSKKE